MTNEENARFLYESGIVKYLDPETSDEETSDAIKSIILASNLGNADAQYFVGAKVLSGEINLKKKNPEEYALKLLKSAANSGNMNARCLLNAYCVKRDQDREIKYSPYGTEGPLRDFDGKLIKINRTGIKTPVDAVLSYENGVNTLKLSLNVLFCDAYDELGGLEEMYQKAVLEGIRSWAGRYEVFGGQKLNVEISVSTETHVYDMVDIVYMGPKMREAVRKVSKISPNKANRENLESTLRDDRSFAISGVFKWSVNSRKNIYMNLSEKDLHDPYEIKCVAKHEFGHVLGLGDLYYEPGKLEGVAKGKYSELDSYLISDKNYNLVMDDHHGVISNNDIEMIVLAFSENRAQLYQPTKGIRNKKISEALGKGN